MASTLHHSAYDYGSPIGSVWDHPGNPAPRSFGRLEGSETCDVVVVGAGITGLSAAYHLANDYRAQVIVIDAAAPGWGSSGRGLGFCGPLPALAYRRATAKGRNLPDPAAMLAADLEALDVVNNVAQTEGFALHKAGDGILTGVSSPADLDTLAAEWAGYDPENRFARQTIDAATLRDTLFGSAYTGGALKQTPGFAIDPLYFTYQLALACERSGVRIYGGTRVREILERGSWVSVRYRGGTLSAAHAVIATNALSRGRAMPELADRMIHLVSHALGTRPLSDPELKANNLSQPVNIRFEDDVCGPTLLRVLPDRRLIVSAMVTMNADPQRAADVRQRMRSRFLSLLPGLRDVHVAHSWRSVGGRTATGLPFVGPLSSKGRMIYAGGLDLDSTSLSAWLGRTAADLAASNDDVHGRAYVSRTPLHRIRFAGVRSRVLARKINQLNQQG